MTSDSVPTGGIQPYPDEDQVFVSLYDSAEFAEFEQEMDDLLAVLVGQWVHLAAPSAAAGAIRRMSKSKSKKPAT